MKQMIIEVMKTNKKAIMVGALTGLGVVLLDVAIKAVTDRDEELVDVDTDGESSFNDAVDVEYTETEE